MKDNIPENKDSHSNEARESLLDLSIHALSARTVDQACVERVIQRALQLKSDVAETRHPPVMTPETDNGFTATRVNMRLLQSICGGVAALICVASTGWLFVSNGKNAFAQVQEAVTNIRSVQFRISDFQNERAPLVTTSTFVTGVGARREGPNGIESIVNLKEKKSLTINHKAKTATLHQLYITDASQSQISKFFQVIRSSSFSEVKVLAPGTLDGKQVDRYAFQDHGNYTVSVDPASKLPVRMEMNLEHGLSSDRRFREVIDDFVYDMPVDESQFEIEPPADYRLEVVAQPADRKPLDVSNFIVSAERGFNGLPFGSTKEQVLNKLGAPDFVREKQLSTGNSDAAETVAVAPLPNPVDDGSIEPPMIVSSYLYYPSLGFDLTIGRKGLESIRCYGRDRMGDLARDFLGKTDKAIRLGWPLRKVIAEHGKPEVRTSGRDEVLYYPHAGYQFMFVNSKLIDIRVTKPMSEMVEIQDNGDGTWSTSTR